MPNVRPFFLFVGDMATWQRSGRGLPDMDGAAFVDFRDITAETLARFKPDILLCPLFVPAFDARDVAMRLAELGYKGLLRAVTQPLPRPELVIAEVSLVAPDLDFDLFEIPDAI